MPPIICNLISIYLLCLFGRLVLSWFPISPGSPVASVFSVLYAITEPLLGPARRAIPSIGMLDVSPIVVIVGIQLVSRALGC